MIVRAVVDERKPGPFAFGHPEWALVALAVLTTTLRFEGAFLVAGGVAVLLLRRRIPLGVAVLAGGVLPIVVFGLVSIANHSYFFPNSVLLKANLTSGQSFIANLGQTIVGIGKQLTSSKGTMAALAPATVFAAWQATSSYRRAKTPWNRQTVVGVLFVATTVAHAALAGLGHFRYFAYLGGLFALTVACALAPPGDARPDHRRQKRMVAAALLAGLFFLAQEHHPSHRGRAFDAEHLRTTRADGALLKAPLPGQSNRCQRHRGNRVPGGDLEPRSVRPWNLRGCQGQARTQVRYPVHSQP